MVIDSSRWPKNLQDLLQVELTLMVLHLVHKVVMSLLKVLPQSAALLLRPVASSVVDLFQDHPKLSSML